MADMDERRSPRQEPPLDDNPLISSPRNERVVVDQATTGEDHLEAIADRCERVRWKPGQRGFTASCAVETHEDRNPSLSVGLGDDGRLLVNCFGGCDVRDVVDALGLTMRDLFPQPTRRRWTPRRQREEDAQWKRVIERAIEQQRREGQPWYWRYRAALFEWAGCSREAAACRHHADLLEEDR